MRVKVGHKSFCEEARFPDSVLHPAYQGKYLFLIQAEDWGSLLERIKKGGRIYWKYKD